MSSRVFVDAAAVVGTALLLGMTLLSARQDPATAVAPHVIDIVAQRFEFQPHEIEVIEGERVQLRVKSADGVHGFRIKKVKVNKLIPRCGEIVMINFVAPAPGTYEIACSEECGEGHEAMTGTLVVRAKAK